MIDTAFMQDALGFIAGGLIAGSSIPQLIANIRRPHLVAHQSVERNVMIFIGNALWVGFGVWIGATPIVVFCGLNVVLNGVLIIQRFRQRTVS